MLNKQLRPEKLKLTTVDIVEDKKQQLKKIFPEVFCEDKIDFDQLKQVLGEWVEPGKELFGLNWLGRANCKMAIQSPSFGTLKPCRDESVNFDKTGNVFIEGENLEVLKLLQKAYSGKVKMIYIDPPYNTGKDFIYKDNYKEPLKNYLAFTGQIDGEGRKLSTDLDKSGGFHSNWLNMMYPRLLIASRLLCDDGVIFISVDDHEVSNLKVLCNHVFGEENFVSSLIWDLSSGTQAGHFTRSHEYILVFTKNKQALSYFKDLSGGNINDRAIKQISVKNPATEISFVKGSVGFEGVDASFPDELGLAEKQYVTQGRLVFKGGYLAEDVTIKAGWAMKKQIVSWLDGKETYDSKGQRVIRFYFNRQGILSYEKARLTCHPRTILSDAGNTRNGSNEVLSLLGCAIMDFPKPTRLLKLLVGYVCTEDNDIVLDFFAGSGTTAHAVMKLNAEDGGKRQYICVQIPEQCNQKPEAFKAGYKTIADIAKERIRRAAKKIEEENPDIDLGFKVFKLDQSNFKAWDNNVEDSESLQRQLDLSIDHINPNSSVEDILYEILLKDDYFLLPLTTKIEKKQFVGKDVYSIENEGGTTLVCLEKQITAELIDAIAEIKPYRVICLDAGFKGNDQLKMNSVKTFETAGHDGQKVVFETV